ncbi:1 TM domain-containing transmembrane protein [Acrasis kona]|uniref:1 TM domain-containing transmembrane protein n=1 Tax=Acrasis kona TaxID=1008807 RepID=A0AAW2Z8F1_9EUKA
MADHLSNTMAALCAAGGIAGYVKAKSVPSLIGGLGLGLIYAYSSYTLTKEYDVRNCYFTGTVASGILLATGSSRLFKTGKLMPAGIMAGLGAATTSYYFYKFQTSK